MASKRVVTRWLTAVILGVPVISGTVGRLGAEPGVVVHMEGGRLSVSAEAVPLKDIVAEIARATSIKISGEARLDPQLVNEERTLRFRELEVEEAFRRLFPHNNFVVVHSPAGIQVDIHAPGQAPPPQATRNAGQTAPSSPMAAPGAPVASPGAPTTAPSAPTDVKGDPAALRSTALSDPDPAKRAQAMSQLSRDTDKDIAGETALNVLDRDREPAVLESALDALRFHPPAPLDPLIRFAANGEQKPELRVRAIELLRDNALGNGEVQALLRSAAAQDRSQEVQAAAKRILETTGIR